MIGLTIASLILYFAFMDRTEETRTRMKIEWKSGMWVIIYYLFTCVMSRNELGWSPKYTFEQGIRQTIQWYLDNQDWNRVISGEYMSYYQRQYGPRLGAYV